MSKKFSLVPRSNAATLYQLFDDIVEVIEAEPLRMDMGNWIRIDTNPHDVFERNFPVCGTVGCIAGWMVILTRKRESMQSLRKGSMQQRATDLVRDNLPSIEDKDWDSPEALAQNELMRDLDAVFDGDISREAYDLDLRKETAFGSVLPEPGEKDYVRCVVHRIRTFQKKWEDTLRNAPCRVHNKEER